MRALVFGMLILIVAAWISSGEDRPSPDGAQGDLAATAGKPNEEAASGCEEDWRDCDSLEDFHKNNLEDRAKASRACKLIAESAANYGDPEFPRFPFGTTLVDRNAFAEDGIVNLREEDAQFQNGFGAMVNVMIECAYSLKKETVVDINVID